MNETNTFLRQLRLHICEHFSLTELKTLAFDLALNWDELEGETLSLKCQSLIGFMQRNGRLPELLALLRQERPGITWPSLPTKPKDPISKVSDAVRTAVWNSLFETLWNKKTFLKSFRKQEPLIDKFSLRLWADFFIKPIDARPQETEQILQEMREYFFTCDESEFYRYLVFILNYWNDLRHYQPEIINRAVNKALAKTGTGLHYMVENELGRFQKGFIAPLA